VKGHHQFVQIPVTHDGEGLNGVVRRLHAIGYYATIIGNSGDVVVLYGPRVDHYVTRSPYVALIGDTISVSDRSAEQKPESGD